MGDWGFGKLTVQSTGVSMRATRTLKQRVQNIALTILTLEQSFLGTKIKLEKLYFCDSLVLDFIQKTSSIEYTLSILRGVVYIDSRMIQAQLCIFPSSLLTLFDLDQLLSIYFGVHDQHLGGVSQRIYLECMINI